MSDHLDGWPCHKKPREQWCDHSGPGGFMGHTCGNESDDDYRVRLMSSILGLSDLDRNALRNSRSLDVVGIKHRLPRRGTVSCISCLKCKPYSQIKLALSNTMLVCDECDRKQPGGDNVPNEKTTEHKIKRPDEALSALGELFRSRNAVYGSTYKDFGAVMRALIPGEIKIETEEDWNRLAIFFHCADKLARYGRQFKNGGHKDSLDDVSVYAQLLQECDEELRQKKVWPTTIDERTIYVSRPSGDRIVSSQPITFSNPTPSEEEAPVRFFYVGGSSAHAKHGETYWIKNKEPNNLNPIAAVFVDYEGGPGPRFSYAGGLVEPDKVDILSWIERPRS